MALFILVFMQLVLCTEVVRYTVNYQHYLAQFNVLILLDNAYLLLIFIKTIMHIYKWILIYKLQYFFLHKLDLLHVSAV